MKRLFFMLALVGAFSVTWAQTFDLVNVWNSPFITPPDSIGAFCRVFHNPTTSSYYVTYAGGPHANQSMNRFFWRQFSSLDLSSTSQAPISTSATPGDYAMVRTSTNYYHLGVDGGTFNLILTKLDLALTPISSTTIVTDGFDSNMDQMFNFANGKLIIGLLHTNCCPNPTPGADHVDRPLIHIYQYDLDLNPISNTVLTPPYSIAWGASIVWNSAESKYHIVTCDNLDTHRLMALHYDASFNYLGNNILDENGQWSQGLLWDGTFYYVAYHEGHHNKGNVVLQVFNASWAPVKKVNVTNYAVSDHKNAQRPSLCKVGNYLYVGYDIETFYLHHYDMFAVPVYVNNSDWQPYVAKYQISNFVPAKVAIIEDTEIQIYPNPAQDQITVQMPGNGSVAIYDLQGRKLMTKSVENEGNIPTSEFARGIYIVEIRDANASVLKRERLVLK